MNPRNPSHSIESGIKTQDTSHTVSLHNSNMKRIASGKSSLLQHNVSSPLDIAKFDRENLVGNRQKPVESRPDSIPTIDRSVAVEDLL